MAEDLTSVVFLEAWKKRADVDLNTDTALPWLLGVATNVCRNATRSLYRYRDALSRVPEAESTDQLAEDVAARVDAEIKMTAVLRALNRLSASDQEILQLCVWDELEYAEAAARLKIPLGTVRSRLSRARERLGAETEKELASIGGHKEGEEDNE